MSRGDERVAKEKPESGAAKAPSTSRPPTSGRSPTSSDSTRRSALQDAAGPAIAFPSTGATADRDTHVASTAQVQAAKSRTTSKRSGGAALKRSALLQPGTITFAQDGRTPTRIEIPVLPIPDLANKATAVGPLRAAPPNSRPSGQREIWRNEIADGAFDAAIAAKLKSAEGVPTSRGGKDDRVHFLKATNQNSFVIGTVADIRSVAMLPNWGPDGARGLPLEVDHIHEAQLSGRHALDNFQLLDRTTNGATGNRIRRNIADAIDVTTAQYVGEGLAWPDRAPSADAVRAQCRDIVFTRVVAESMPGRAMVWTVGDIRAAKHIDALVKLTVAQAHAAKLIGGNGRLMLFLSEAAAAGHSLAWTEADAIAFEPLNRRLIRSGYRISAMQYAPGGESWIDLDVLRSDKVAKIVVGAPMERLPLIEIGGLPFTTRVDGAELKRRLRSILRARGMSPIVFDEVDILGDVLSVRGAIHTTVPIFADGVTIDIAIDGDEIRLSKTFELDEFALPRPLRVTGSSLTLSVGTAGLRAEGAIEFEIERVGRGVLRGIGNIASGFGVEGEFDLDPTLFPDGDGRVRLRYEDGRLSGEGELRIGDGQIRGIKSAHARVAVDGSRWEAEGSVAPSVPGVREGQLAIVIDPEVGLTIQGRLDLDRDIPRLKKGHIEARVAKGEDGWTVAGRGNAQLDIPGGDAAIDIEYRDGLFRAWGSLALARGIAKGRLEAGVTNMVLDDAGDPTGEISDRLIVHGYGSVTVQFTPWLEGTGAVRLAPDGRISLMGEILLPSALEVFPTRSIEKPLLENSVDIPIVGVSVLGKRVGIFLNLGYSLSTYANIGPGRLERLVATVDYDLDAPESARIRGSSLFVVAADAGVRLTLTGAIGAGLLIVSARGGLGVTGDFGVAAAAAVEADILWSPQHGIDLAAKASVTAKPRLALTVDGFVEVEADLLLKTVNLYARNWELGRIELGSDFEIGAAVPIAIERSMLRPIDVRHIEFIKPDLDPIAIARRLVDRIR